MKRLSVKETCEQLRDGKVVVVPTDTVYGLAARFDCRKAVERIYELKGRDFKKPLAILGASKEQLDRFVLEWVDVEWPGAITIVVPCKNVPEWVNSGLQTIGLRIPDHKELLEVIEEVGPIVATSANRSGETEDHFFDLDVMEGECGSGVPSKVITYDGRVVRGQ